MADSARSTPPPPPAQRASSTAAIVAMVGKGMTAKQILRLFPELSPDDVRSALLRAADVVRDENASLCSDETARAALAEMRADASLSEDEAVALAVEETRAHRREQAKREP